MDLTKAKTIKIEDLDSKDAKWTKLQLITYEDPTGKVRTWEAGARTTRVEGSDVDGVGIVAIVETETGPEIVLQKQYRAPIEGICIEIPAGLLDPNESIEQCAERELLEETGYVGKAYAKSATIFNDPGFCNTNLSLVQVSIDPSDPRNQNPQPQLEENEFIETFRAPLSKLSETLDQLVKEGCKLDARVQNIAAGIALARKYRDFV